MADYYYTEEELTLLKEINFSKEIFEILKRAIVEEVRNLEKVIPKRFAEHILASYPHTIEPLYTNNFAENNQKIVGITIRGDVIKNPQQFVLHLNKAVNQLNHQAFLTVASSGSGTDDNISIIKGTDKFELLNFIKLGSFSKKYITEAKIKEKVKKLDQKYSLKIIGVGIDWLELYFPNLPKDNEPLLKEIKECAPDTFIWSKDESEKEACEKIKQSFIKEHSIKLWWED